MKLLPLILAGGLLLLAACGPQSAPPEATPAATETAEALDASPTPTVELPTRQPLPPTWTPFIRPTFTLPPAMMPTADVSPTPYPDECATFRPDYDRLEDTFPLGASPVLYWVQLAGPAGYRIRILDISGRELFVDQIPPDVDWYVVPADVFNVSQEALAFGEVPVFGWEVLPLDSAGQPYCQTIAGELIPITISTEAPQEGTG